MQWKTGDDVVLKGGGPTMTVNRILDDGDVYCQWIDGNGDVKEGYFKPDMLRKASEAPAKPPERILRR
jgi:uncharacterized protein YodC (DUF2158 family)